jgi:DNA-binding transcriptional LysR family regulator
MNEIVATACAAAMDRSNIYFVLDSFGKRISMDLRKFRYFVAVAEELNFSRAARRLHISQPPLSQQIKAIEDEIGARLLERTKRRVELTEPGRLFLERARAVLQAVDGVGEAVRRVARGEEGEIRIAFTDSVPLFEAFPRFVQAFRERYPNVRLELGHMPTGTQLQALADRRIDVGILRPSVLFTPAPEIAVHRIWEDELNVVLPVGHRLARTRGGIRMADLADEPFILFPRGSGCGLHDHVLTLCNQAGFAPRLAQEAREGTTIMALVAAGTGISVLPDRYRQAHIPHLAYRPILSAASRSRLLLAWHAANQAPLVARFVAMAKSWPGFGGRAPGKESGTPAP